jgi:hypothetical protein
MKFMSTFSSLLRDSTYTASTDFQLNNFTLALKDKEASNFQRELLDKRFNKYYFSLILIIFGMIISFLIKIANSTDDFELRDLVFLGQTVTILFIWTLLKKNTICLSPTIVVFLIPFFIGINKNIFVRGLM